MSQGLPKVGLMVWGIISYTHWPNEQGPLRLCLPEGNANAILIGQYAKEVDIGRPVVTIMAALDTDTVSAQTCDVVYFADMSVQDAGRILRTLTGGYVLTLGDGQSFCSEGGMFCILPDHTDDKNSNGRFAANLDAISRSALRVNPRVLRLSRPANEGGR
ncbi:MAG: YfiR family protein [Azoarcus sp.]|nr:YfiR family protein [Azoarcus sp.]